MDSKKTGTFIAAQRKQLSMTQQDVANQLNITNKAISKWETGEGYPDITVLPALAEILHVTVDELLKGERNPSDQPSGDGFHIRENKQQAEFLLKNSMRHFSNLHLAALGIMMLGIIASSLCLQLFRGYLPMLGYPLIISLAFLVFGMVFYINACTNLKEVIKKYNTMQENEDVDLHHFFFKKHILFYAVYAVQVTICVGVIPLYPFLSHGYHYVFGAWFGYNSIGRLVIDFNFSLALDFALYCLLMIIGLLVLKKRNRER